MRRFREVTEQVIYFLFVQAITALLVAFPAGLFFMLGVAGVHSWWPHDVPTVDYWSAYWISALLLLVSSIRPSRLKIR